MNFAQLLDFITQKNVRLWLEKGHLHYSAPRGIMSPDITQELSGHRLEIIDFLEKKDLPLIALSEKFTTTFPTTYGQESLWLQYQLEGPSTTYNIPVAVELVGNLSINALEKSINTVIKRHSILRTTFAINDDQIVQNVHDFNKCNLDIVDTEGLGTDELVRRLTEDSKHLFDLTTGPLLKILIYRVGHKKHLMLAVSHHIISDGWSLGIMLNEVVESYQAFLANTSFLLPDLPLQYSDYAVWQRQRLTGKYLEYLLDYWKQQLSDAQSLLALPFDHLRPSIQAFVGNDEYIKLESTLTSQLRVLSQYYGSSLFMVTLSAFVILLWKYSGQDDITIGTPIANRNHKEIEGLIGLFINTIPLRFHLDEKMSFTQFLEQTKQISIDAARYQDLPFELLVKELQPERVPGSSPFFQVIFTFQNLPFRKKALPELLVSPLVLKTNTAKFDIELIIEDVEQQLKCTFEYNTELFDSSTIQRMASHYKNILVSIIDNPELPIVDLRHLSSAEYKKILLEWNDRKIDIPEHLCYVQLFETQVEKTPNAIAVVYKNEKLTYKELNAQANRLAWSLIRQGIGPDLLVAILLERNIDFLIAILGILKAGGAYLPLDPLTPMERINQIIQISEAKVVLTSDKYSSLLNKYQQEVAIKDLPELLSAKVDNELPDVVVNPLSRCKPEDLAYIIFTSGSTGIPKGAMIEHRGMLNHLYGKIHDLNISYFDKVAQTASQSFDISVWQFLVALIVGGQTFIYSDDITRDPTRLFNVIRSDRITILEIVPSFLNVILNELDSREAVPDALNLRWLIITGESLPPLLSRRWLNYYPAIPLMNAYGPTECSDDVTHFPIYTPLNETMSITPIGRPLPNLKIYILDRGLHPVSIGVSGEIYVGGVGVGRGYINDLERTNAVFINDPFSIDKNDRLYKTGDLGRFLLDGNIEFLGRVDYQVKIRGYRIELGEIEQNIRKHSAIQDVVVIALDDGESQLIAYIVPKEDNSVKIDELREYLHSKLPPYMIPAIFIVLESIPLTFNGKVNRKLLPLPDARLRPEMKQKLVRPHNKRESRLLEVWEEVLGIKEIGVFDNFFDLGGDSLKAVRIVSKLEGAVSLVEIFQNPTIEGLAKLMQSNTRRKNKKLLQQLSPNSIGGRISLICLPYAGGNAVIYYQLAKSLPEYIKLYAVELPGHDYGAKNEGCLSFKAIVDKCASEIENIEGPIAVYGHCVGTALAIELTNRLRQSGHSVSATFVAAGLPFQQKRIPGFLLDPFNYFVPDSTIINFLKSLDGFHDLENPDDPEQIRFLLHNFRHDTLIALKYFEKYRGINSFSKLETPLFFIVGDKDLVTANYSVRVPEWETFAKRVFLDVIPNAGHFFVKENTSELARIIISRINPLIDLP